MGLDKTISLPELVTLGKFVSLERGRARVEVVTPDRVWWVVVVDLAE